MSSHERSSVLFAEAVELLREADRMHRQFFGLGPARAAAGPSWEPPVDIIESDRGLTIRIALPGVPANTVEVTTVGTTLRVVAVRPMDALHGDVIHRLEIPYGRFERHIELPRGRYEMIGDEHVDGCLTLVLRRLA